MAKPGFFRGSSSSMAARYNISGDSEDELAAVERSTFEDLISQFTTSQGDVGSARRGDRENYVFLQQLMWTREQSAKFDYQGGLAGGSEGQDMNMVVRVALTRIDNQFQELYTSMAHQDNLVKQSLQQIATSLIYVDQKTDHLYNGLIEFRKELDELTEKNNQRMRPTRLL